MWAGRGRVVSTQAVAWDTWVQACWKAVWGFCKFLPFFGKKTQKLPKKKSSFSCTFFSSGISQPGLLRLHLSYPGCSVPGVSFAHVRRPSFVHLRSLSVASRLFSLSPLVLCHSSHCQLPADFFLFRPLSCAIQATVSCQPTSFGFAPGFVPFQPLSVASRLFSLSPLVLCHSGHCRFTSRLPTCWGGVRTHASTVTLSATNVCLATSAIVAFTLNIDIWGTLSRIF